MDIIFCELQNIADATVVFASPKFNLGRSKKNRAKRKRVYSIKVKGWRNTLTKTISLKKR